MLLLTLHILIISLTCIVWGIPILLLFPHTESDKKSLWGTNYFSLLSFLFFAGIILLSFITSWWCLLYPLKFSYLLILTVFPLILAIKKKKLLKLLFTKPFSERLSTIETFLTIALVLVFIMVGILKPSNNDTGIYHVQIIRWLSEYGTVPGIANLFPRYGLGSNWFSLISVFKIPFYSYQNFTWLNTTSVIWFFTWLFGKWKYHSTESRDLKTASILAFFYFLVMLYCFFEWELFRDAANSTNYDFIVTALTLISISYLIESILNKHDFNIYSPFLVILIISVTSFKFSGSFILFLLFFYLLNFRFRFWLLSFLTAIMILSPILIKNYITTGYPLYPLSFSINHPDWQLPSSMTDYLRQYITISNRFYNSSSVDFTRIPELMNHPWIITWINGLLIQQKVIIGLSFSSLLIFFTKNHVTIQFKRLKLLFLILFIMEAGWFFIAPSPRFSYGFLLVLAFFPVSYFTAHLIPDYFLKLVLSLTLAVSVYYLYKKVTPVIIQPALLIHTERLDRPPLNTIKIDGMTFYLPEIINDGWMRDCFNTDLPCISNENKYLQPRGESLKDGFRMYAQPDSTFIRNYIY